MSAVLGEQKRGSGRQDVEIGGSRSREQKTEFPSSSFNLVVEANEEMVDHNLE